MDKASDDVAKVFANGLPFEVFTPRGVVKATAGSDLSQILPYTPAGDPNNPGRRDSLGSTHHEAGTLRMGPNPGQGVTDSDGRFRDVSNAYVAGPALFPTLGSPEPDAHRGRDRAPDRGSFHPARSAAGSRIHVPVRRD